MPEKEKRLRVTLDLLMVEVLIYQSGVQTFLICVFVCNI